MLSIDRAATRQDFEAAAVLCLALAELDVAEAEAAGLPAEVVRSLFHGETIDSLAEKYSKADTALFVGRWNGAPAGCLAFGPFGDGSVELHKFYVDPGFRGRGVGSALMRQILGEVDGRAGGAIVLQTAVYLEAAISLYRSFGFDACPPFRDVPDSIRHTEVFMSRKL